MALPLLIAPTNPKVSRFHLPSGRGPQQAGQFPLAIPYPIAQVRTEGHPASQIVIAFHMFTKVQTLFSTARGDRRPPLSEAEEQAKNPEVFLGCAAPGRESCPGRSPPVRRSAPPAASSLAVGPSAGCW